MMKSFLSLLLAGAAFACAEAQSINQPGAGPGGGARYATDAYPGFDSEKAIIAPEKKTPRWFAWWNGPDAANATAQLRRCEELLASGSDAKAAKQLDALVREWPTSPEAPVAQKLLAETLLTRLEDYEEAFAEYRYLIDFFSLQCDYAATVDQLYKIANLLRQEGKTIVFFRFKNTVDVRRAFETCVLRAPGAVWAPEALLTIADLREEEGKFEEAIKVYENLRNIHAETPEAKKAVARESAVRMVVLREHGYNRDRCRDTINFLRQALTTCDLDDVEAIKAYLGEALGVFEDEAYRAAVFYDSRTRTRRSAISSYEQFLADYPESVHAEEIRQRLSKLKEEAEK